MWKATVEERLHGMRSLWHEPGTILELRAQQKLHASFVRGVRGRRAGFMERHEHFAGCIGVAWQRRELGPPTIASTCPISMSMLNPSPTGL
jgi:hypothetical protein